MTNSPFVAFIPVPGINECCSLSRCWRNHYRANFWRSPPISPVLPERFTYEGTNGDTSLPDWLRYHSAVGAIAGRYCATDRRLVIAVAVPTRAYCAAFTALGAITANASGDEIFVESESQFKQLCELRHNAAVLLRKGKRKLKGRYTGVDTLEKNGIPTPHVRIQVNSRAGGGTTHLISPELAHRVEISVGNRQELPKQQKGHRIKSSIEFVDEFFPDHSLDNVALKSRLLCAIVGRANTLMREMKDTRLAVQNPEQQETARGTLQDVVRIRSFGAETDHFLAEVVPADSKTMETDEAPPVVVFDGSYGFLKQRSRWPQSNLVVVLDRTEPGFDDAVNTQNENYMKRRAADDQLEELGSLPDAPPGVEIVAFEEKCGCKS